MTIKLLDLTGLTYFKNKFHTETASAIQSALNIALANYTTNANLFTVVSTLPASGTEGRAYLVPNADDGTKYDIYTWENNAWKGNTGGSITITIDTVLNANSNNAIANSTVTTALGDKVDRSELVAITSTEIDNLFV